VNGSAAQNNIGNIHLALGMREGGAEGLELAMAAFDAALASRDRAKAPQEWAATQNNIGLASYTIAERRGDAKLLARAEAAYRGALEVFTRDTNPMGWGMLQNNLGNVLNAIGLQTNDLARHDQAAEA